MDILPYITKDSDLINFSITADATLSFELVTNGKHHKLESRTIDKKLWRQWMHVAVTWDGRDSCGKTILYVNSVAVAQSCLGKPLSAEGTDNLLLGGLVQKTTTDHSETLIDDIAIWRQPLMPIQIDALYSLGNRFSYNASEVDTLFNTPEKDGVTKIRDHRWQRTTLEHTSQNERLIIKELPNATKIQFGKVMAIRCLACRPQI